MATTRAPYREPWTSTLWAAIRYRGGAGYLTWILHRLTGLGVLLFLLVHVIDTWLIVWSAPAYNYMTTLYRMPVFRLMEVGLAAAVLFHSFNGVRICVIDFWPRTGLYQREMAWAVGAGFVVCFIPMAWAMIVLG